MKEYKKPCDVPADIPIAVIEEMDGHITDDGTPLPDVSDILFGDEIDQNLFAITYLKG